MNNSIHCVSYNRFHLLVFLLLIATTGYPQTDSTSVIADIKKFQQELNEEYKNVTKSPLSEADRKQFTGHDFFSLNLQFRVVAKLKITKGTPFFKMKTTTVRLDEERIYGFVEFSLQGRDFRLPVYQSSKLMKTNEYRDYLFFPFTDLTNGEESYHGGRYIDLRIPQGEDIVVDFNKAYNPYCAYNSKFSCPIVPKENNLEIKVPAGVKYREKR